MTQIPIAVEGLLWGAQCLVGTSHCARLTCPLSTCEILPACITARMCLAVAMLVEILTSAYTCLLSCIRCTSQTCTQLLQSPDNVILHTHATDAYAVMTSSPSPCIQHSNGAKRYSGARTCSINIHLTPVNGHIHTNIPEVQ